MAEVTFNNKINIPFAEEGDKTEIPDESVYDLVNKKEGFTELYETAIGEGGEYIERGTMNQVLYDTQSAVKEIQELGEGDGFPADLTNSNGILPVVNGGTGNSDGKAPSAEVADSASVADEAVKLQTARTIRTNLASTSTASFDGTANITPGVTGTLPVGNGGTGITSNPSMLVNLASNSSASVFASSPRPGVTGVLPIANGGTGSSSQYSLSGIYCLTSQSIIGTNDRVVLVSRATSSNTGSYYVYIYPYVSADSLETIQITDGIYRWYSSYSLGYIESGYTTFDLDYYYSNTILSKINSALNKSFSFIEFIGLGDKGIFPLNSYYTGYSLSDPTDFMRGGFDNASFTYTSTLNPSGYLNYIYLNIRGYYLATTQYSNLYFRPSLLFNCY